MKRFIIATIFSLGMAAGAEACAPEKPTHNSYVFSVFRREAVGSPFRDDMNDWWKRYGGEPESTDEYYYMGNRERLRKIAQKRADGGMTSYMRMLDAYLEISDGVGMDSWNYPTKQELARRDSTLRRILAECGGHEGGKHAGQFALMTMRANMLQGRDKANMLYWTATASKLPEGVWRDVCRNIYARALLNNGLTRQATDIYAEQGDMQSIRWCMKGYRNMAGIRKVYADDPDSPTLLYLVQDLVNNLQETLDTRAAGPDAWRIGAIGTRTVETGEARAFVSFADEVLKEGKTASPCLWQSAAAMPRKRATGPPRPPPTRSKSAWFPPAVSRWHRGTCPPPAARRHRPRCRRPEHNAPQGRLRIRRASRHLPPALLPEGGNRAPSGRQGTPPSIRGGSTPP